MEIRIDTSKESAEDIRVLIELLSKLVDKNPPKTEDKGFDMPSGFFDPDSSDKDSKQDNDIRIIPY